MTASLSGVHLKLKQAKLHLDALNARLDEANRGHLYGLVCEPDAQPGQYLVKVEKVASDEDWPLILGDVIHNLHTALDHLVWQLVLANGKTPSSRNEFGTYQDPGLFDGPEGDKDFQGVHRDAQAVIRAVQPFRQGDEGPKGNYRPLWLLRGLEIVDKHRLIHTVALVPEEITLTFREASTGPVEMFDLSGRILEDGTQVCRIASDFKPKVEMNSSLSLLVFLEETELTPRLPWGVLDAMRDEVERVVRLLTPFVVWPP
jgi:hypothetical protein